MALAEFTFTDRCRPIIEFGIGDVRSSTSIARWDVARWDAPDALWSGVEPAWLDISCDVRAVRIEYGRRRTTDRFVVGQMTVVVDNATGWADPNLVDLPGVLTVRPGRQMRVSIDHETLGRRVLFRGYVDGMNPSYVPTEQDSVDFSVIDALGEVNRARFLPLEMPDYAGDTVDQRIGRILDICQWPPDLRDLEPSGDALRATDLSGQAADLLGQAAESGGGSIYGDTNGRVVYRSRDWQAYVPDSPVDGTIGNVENGHIIPGTPQVDGWLDGNIGYASTPDTPDLTITGDVRITAKIRTVRGTITAATFMGIARHNNGWTVLYRIDQTGPPGSVYRVDEFATTGAATSRAMLTGTAADALFPEGADAYVGALFDTQVITTPRTVLTALQSPDGRTWAKVGAGYIGANLWTWPDPTQPLQVGVGWHGRIYWAQLEQINRRSFVFPGLANNYMLIANGAGQIPTGDIECVARVWRADWSAPYGIVLAKNGPWYFLVGSTVHLWSTVQGGSATFPQSSAHGFANDAAGWIKATRVAATGVTAFYTAPDSPTEPTTWTARGTVTGPTGPLSANTSGVTLGAYSVTGSPFAGRILRAIMRDGIGGPALIDVAESNASTVAAAATAFTSGDTGNRFVYFPGTVGNYLSIPNLWTTGGTTQGVEIIVRVSAKWKSASADYLGIVYLGSRLGLRRDTASTFQFYSYGADGTATTITGTVPAAWVDDQTVWLRATNDGTTLTLEWAPDSATVPSTWTQFRVPLAAATPGLRASATTLNIGTDSTAGTIRMLTGRVRRVIIRDTIGGAARVDFDATANLDGISSTATTFALTTGGTATVVRSGSPATGLVTGRWPVTVTQTLPDLYPIIRALPDLLVWRFDANDYPGSGTSYTDPRGRTWTVTAGALTPKIPGVPDVVVPPDVCPVTWERPFERADIATRAIIGRDTTDAIIRDDQAGIERFGIEPFERLDLLTDSDDTLERIAHRILVTRAAETAPRVRSVTIDARTSNEALDLMTTVDPYLPSRYRCRLQLDRGLVFDEEYLATGVMWTLEPSLWSLQLNLDAATPFAAAGGRWDDAYWDRSTWAVAP